MKKLALLFATFFLGISALHAQDTTSTAPVDSTLIGRNILSVIGPGASVAQTPAVRQALDEYIEGNARKPITGYRIRVYYDNGQQARARSESIEKALRSQYKDLLVYRSFESPNYKVSIGDFRTKGEALRVYNALKSTYPTAYIIKESINYPR